MNTKRPLIISGFGGVGKTMLAKKYKNVIDLESSLYQYIVSAECNKDAEKQKANLNRQKNPEYPENYIKAIKNAIGKYDVICVRYNGIKDDNFLDTCGIEYVVCYPTKAAFNKYYLQRFKQRGNTDEFIEVIKRYFAICYEKSKNLPNKIVLRGNDTLEDALLRMGVDLVPKEFEEISSVGE